ncbi:hypothetical protein SAY86_017880 [Trapa natans]|uniref:Beta-taxilin n=1 Tax=Trapa natans TaxID=22666 RepID=A0AAN7R7V2_TRANT|nr:hypothetical protein SAY86_017880 [Trapa natans]
MENPAATGLPEVDALPDGFVDSTNEPRGPPTPSLEQEDYRFYHTSEHYDPNVQESGPNMAETSLCGVEKVQKPRNFPVPLSETEKFDASLAFLNENDVECKEQLTLHSNDSCLDELERLPEGEDVKEQAPGEFQSSKISSAENSYTQVANVKEVPLSGSGPSKAKKLEASETKHKNVKRSSKSEKEIWEFTLKYQQILSERDAAIAVRDKLESLCRELQRQNKMLMEECKRVSTDSQNLRLELSDKFQDAIKEVNSKLEHQKEESLSQLKENEMLKIKLKQLADQYVLSEQHHEQEQKQKTLELQIAELKIKQHEEKMIQGQSQMKIYAEQVSQLLATEKNLRLQLTADGEKFQQFQDALVKSNEVFETFKQEIEKMAKSIKDLKKENTFLKGKCERSDITLVELVEERERTKKQMEKMKNQKEKLESLCRTLQAERKQNLLGSNSSDSLQS